MVVLSKEEQEIHLSMSASTPGMWEVYSDWPRMQRRLEKIGAVHVRDAAIGPGKFYELKSAQVLLRKTPQKRVLSAEHREALRKQLASGAST